MSQKRAPTTEQITQNEIAYKIENNLNSMEQLNTKDDDQFEETITTSIQYATRRNYTKGESKIIKLKPETEQIIKGRRWLSNITTTIQRARPGNQKK